MPSTVPRLDSFITFLSKKFDTQTKVPSKAIPNGPSPTGKVPSTVPSAESFVTVLLLLLAT
ncbi:MAG: hypothetical protein LC802_22590 [Acidobacteria bacterium]|nr:hypothetical protein [Acidobacteriota bacterium]